MLKHPGPRRRIVPRQVLPHRRRGEALTVDHDIQVRQAPGLGVGRIHLVGGRLETKLAGDDTPGVVIAADGDEGNAGAAEPSDLSDQELPGSPVLPVPS